MANLTGYLQLFDGDTTSVDSSAVHTVGSRAFDTAGNEYMYAQGVASTELGSWVSLDEAHLTTLTVADAQGRIGVAMAAIVADKYGWYQIYGKASGLCLASFADNGKVYLTSTAGSVDDADVAGDVVIGAIGRSERVSATGLATFELNYPIAQDLAID